MQQKQVYYKSDFTAILEFDGGWLTPFKLKFWTNSPSRSFIASYDGTTYTNCSVLDDGRLLIAFDSHNMGLGTLYLQPEFYLTDEDFADGNCNEVITPFAPTFVDDDEVEYTLALSLTGSSTLETIGTLPAYYQKGDKGDKGDQGETGPEGPESPYAESDHETAEADHATATSDHNNAVSDSNDIEAALELAGEDHNQAETDSTIAATDHTLAASDHKTAAADHKTAAADHTTAEADHTQATSDHSNYTADRQTFATDEAARQSTFETNEASRQSTFETNEASRQSTFDTAEATRQARFEEDAEIVEGYETRLTNDETELAQIASEVSTKAEETDLAPLFDATTEYTYGDLVTYEGELYMCHAAEGHTGEWVEDDFVVKSLADILPSYCRKDGLYPNLTAGLAQGLVGDGTATSKKVLAYQFSDDDNLSPYSSEVPSMSIKGRSISWRQMVDNNGDDEGGDGPAIGGTYVNASYVTKSKPYLMHAQTADGVWEWRVVLVSEEQTFAAAAESAFGYAQTVVADTETVLGSKAIDLLLAFGVDECSAWGTDSDTNLKIVAQLWGFASFDDFAGGVATDGTTVINTQWEYLTTYKAEGELISTKIPAVIRSYKYDEDTGEEVLVAEREVPEAVLQAFPDGYLRQAGSVCDEINETECVKRVGVYEVTGNETWIVSSAGDRYVRVFACNFKGAFSKGYNILCKEYQSVLSMYGNDNNKSITGTAHVWQGNIIVRDDTYGYDNVSNWINHLKQRYAEGNPVTIYIELATPVTTELSTPLSLQVLDATTMLKFEPTDTEEPYAPAQLDMSIDRDYAAIVKQLAINAGIWD